LFLRCFDFLRSGFVIPDQTQESILAWQGLAWCGKARQGKARQGKAWFYLIGQWFLIFYGG
jgi:hypothetical protein